MKIAIINDIHVGVPLTRPGIVRASSHLIEERLPAYFRTIAAHQPDLLINLGDLIRSESEESDLGRYRRLMAFFRALPCPVIHLLGNHDIKRMTTSQVEQIWNEEGFMQKSYGQRRLGHLTLIWLGLEICGDNPPRFRLPDEQLDWLEETLQSVSGPVIIFSHCGIDDHDVRGNFFFETHMGERSITPFFLENHAEIRALIDRSQVRGVFQAHLHYFHAQTIGNTAYITCPAMGDNICAPDAVDNLPEIFTLLFIDEKKSSAKAYSRHFCFAGSDFNTQEKNHQQSGR